jgi:hypothetical protein
MLRQFLVGAGTSLVNIAIHAVIMTLVVYVAQSANARAQSQSSPFITSLLIPTRVAQTVRMTKKSQDSLFLIAVMVPTVSVLMVAHATEVIVWALTYSIVDAAPAGVHLVYLAFVNYTTLGYGDVIPVERWQLLGPMTAMNGVLLFGWSTAVIFEVLRNALRRSGTKSE